MRRNLPVTQRDHPLKAEQSLVSVTDTQGRITCCNPAFAEVSGDSREELLGWAQVVRNCGGKLD